MIRVGTSGWQYRDWRGRFYPDDLAQSRWFGHYATVFSTVEINASFYRLPSEAAIRRWRDQAPDGFRYAAKGSRYLTHRLKLGGDRVPDSVALVCGRLGGLGATLDVVLWQLPPQLHVDPERLARFVGLLPAGMRHAVEFRHPSWLTREVFAVLAGAGVAHVWVSSHAMPPDRTRTADFVYLRLHGLDGGWQHDYRDAELAPWVDAVAAAAADGLDGYVYFNNDGLARAPHNAVRFAQLLDRHGRRRAG